MTKIFSRVRSWVDQFAPIAMLVFSIVLTAFLGGTFTAQYGVFPYPQIRDAQRTLVVLIERHLISNPRYYWRWLETTAVPASAAPTARWTILDKSAPRFPIIASGGTNQYLELCPEQGCLAVAFDSEGKVTKTWPYRPVDIYAVDITDGAYPHEMLSFDPRVNVYPFCMAHYPNGDILVNFHQRGNVFPFGMGVARVGPDGKPRWSRFDFSHHWSTLGAEDVAYIPSLKVGDKNLSFSYGSGPSRKNYQLRCKTGRPVKDIIQIVDGAGHVVEEIELIPVLLASNWAGLLSVSVDPCDPLHLNFVDVVRADAGPGLSPGDLVFSLRNLSRFLIFDPRARKIRRVVAGGFFYQHSVQHLSGTKFLIFDNRGGNAQGPASRLIELDLATGVERRIFPNADTPETYAEVFSDTAGHLDISPDRRRVLASFTHAGRAFEVDIASGRLLSVYDNIHDISSVPVVPEDEPGLAARFSIYGMSYLVR